MLYVSAAFHFKIELGFVEAPTPYVFSVVFIPLPGLPVAESTCRVTVSHENKEIGCYHYKGPMATCGAMVPYYVGKAMMEGDWFPGKDPSSPSDPAFIVR